VPSVGSAALLRNRREAEPIAAKRCTRRRIFPFVVACALSFALPFDEARAAERIKTNELPPDTLIVLQRGACEHRCAVYNVIIFADGSAVFDGRHYVRQPEVIKTRISLESLGDLLAAAGAARFFDLRDRYVPGAPGCESSRSDAPRTIVAVSSGGRAKTIQHYHGCSGPELEQLSQFEEKIDKAVHTKRWVQ